MAFIGDYHTHTPHSHGKSTMEENVVKAIELGLKEIAITDHGFRHRLYNVKKRNWHNIAKEHADLVAKYTQIKIYLGLETNLISPQGELDIVDEDLEYLQIIVAGYHRMVKPYRFRDNLQFFFPNAFANLVGKHTKRLLVRNTDAYVKAIERYPIDIISHPQFGMKVDIIEVAKAAAHYGTYLELNGKRIKSTDSEILDTLEKTTVNYIADSDAHSLDRIGNFDLPQIVVNRINIPYERLSNWENLPNFRSHNGKPWKRNIDTKI
ncbi:MAG: PHP domain-containing protein [Firmicutes bacterium]|nr:PHP domain-containing protein [Bacillota bacterium]MCL1953494.1 PHP domain-containing protein [Bacillota bacterium]